MTQPAENDERPRCHGGEHSCCPYPGLEGGPTGGAPIPRWLIDRMAYCTDDNCPISPASGRERMTTELKVCRCVRINGHFYYWMTCPLHRPAAHSDAP